LRGKIVNSIIGEKRRRETSAGGRRRKGGEGLYDRGLNYQIRCTSISQKKKGGEGPRTIRFPERGKKRITVVKKISRPG